MIDLIGRIQTYKSIYTRNNSNKIKIIISQGKIAVIDSKRDELV